MIRNAKDIGALIRESRKKAGMDQQRLANLVGVSRLWISQVENGKSGAAIGRVLNVLAALGIRLQVADEAQTSDNKSVSVSSKKWIDQVIGSSGK